MANTTKTKKASADTEMLVNAEVNNDNNEKQKIVAKDIDPTQYIIVRNGFQGKLIYESPRTGETFIWEDFGSEQEMELRELKNAKNTRKKFFMNNWFMFDEDWIIDYLGVKQYYKHALKIDEFDTIFTYPLEKLKKTLSQLSEGQKKSIIYRAKVLIADGSIDSLKAIATIEEALGVDLTEKDR